jgi:hypothetical protein
MNMNKRSKFIILLLMILFFGIVLLPVASATPEKSATEKKGDQLNSPDDPKWSKWKEAHTLEVEVTTTYEYRKDGTVKITETYSGEKLKDKFKVDKLTRSQTYSATEVEEAAASLEGGSFKLKPGEKKEFSTKESVVLTAEDDSYDWWTSTASTSFAYPQWTFSKFTLLSKNYYEMEDPINLLWEKNCIKAVKSVILNQRWVDNPVEYTHYLPYPDGSWVAGDGVADSKYRVSGGYHSRFWELPNGKVVSNAHHDDNIFIIPGHQVDGYENAEAKVAGFFEMAPGIYWLDNVCCSSFYNAYNDGSATLF